jgi:hypothetical protein
VDVASCHFPISFSHSYYRGELKTHFFYFQSNGGGSTVTSGSVVIVLNFNGKIVHFTSSVFLRPILVLSDFCSISSAGGWTGSCLHRVSFFAPQLVACSCSVRSDCLIELSAQRFPPSVGFCSFRVRFFLRSGVRPGVCLLGLLDLVPPLAFAPRSCSLIPFFLCLRRDCCF